MKQLNRKEIPAGTRFGRLVVRSLLPVIPPRYRTYYLCQCDCGRQRQVRNDALRSGCTLSCAGSGCRRQDVSAVKRTRHGFSRHPLYGLWAEMRRRCENPKAHNYHLYGGRGIAVCERWHTFANFLADMPPRPDRSHTLDRVDNNGGYRPGNVAWKTHKEQSRNTRTAMRVSVNGQEFSLHSASKTLGLASAGPFTRMMAARGITAQQAVDAWMRETASKHA